VLGEEAMEDVLREMPVRILTMVVVA
jgi:hypothetical protein